MNRASWKKILSRVFVEEIPDEFISSINIHLTDGTFLTVANEDEFMETVSTLRFDSDNDPIVGIEFAIDYNKIRAIVEKDIDELLTPIMNNTKPKGEK